MNGWFDRFGRFGRLRRPLVAGLVLVACSNKPAERPDTPASSAAATPAAGKTADATPTQPDATAQGEPAKANAEPAVVAAAATVGAPAPDFTLSDVDGKAHELSDYRGKIVVLEWFNPQCPFVEFAHTKGPLVDMAKAQVEQGVVWLSINSGAPGKQGHGEAANRAGIETYGMVNPVLMDEDGSVGHTYGAVKTPHMFVVDPAGTLVYAGGIDNAPFGEVDGGGEKVNYVAAVLEELRAGKPVTTSSTAPYGCTVKYGSKA